MGVSDPEEWVVLSGATEAINTAICSFVKNVSNDGAEPHVIAATVEHSAVLGSVRDREIAHTLLKVDSSGQICENNWQEKLAEFKTNDHPILFVFQLANNETGICFNLLNKLKEIKETFGERAHVLLDGAQAYQKRSHRDIRLAMHYADYLSVSAHKVGGPTGIGALWVRKGAPFVSLVTGGSQERKRRAGTVNAIGVAGFYLALKAWQIHGDQWREKMQNQRNYLKENMGKMQGVHFFEHPEHMLPNTICFAVEGCPEQSLLTSLDLSGYFLSSGSACNSGSISLSHVLEAMSVDEKLGQGAVRLSVGVDTDQEELEGFLGCLREKVEEIRSSQAKADQLLGQDPF